MNRVTSNDGTTIAYDRVGEGPPIMARPVADGGGWHGFRARGTS